MKRFRVFVAPLQLYQAIKNGLLPVVTPVGEVESYTKNGFNAFYLDSNNIIASAKEFFIKLKMTFKSYNVGKIINKQNYPEFDDVFFHEIENMN
ncbi:hypothetical protein [Photobacterium leiognathi]|uniref:hypothetical protein n=1 Tax=Photobacterium leiognathi TaxID=553611 RepID=UPI002739AD39|nr:hypothetical protein [Photobacterium leiognathi]